MPREFGSDGHDGPLVFSAVVECSHCGEEFEGLWSDPSVDVEQVVEPPKGPQTCPHCLIRDDYEYTGFINYGDAG